nr:hypothetical protein [candidate division Zixibacteria bacterium]
MKRLLIIGLVLLICMPTAFARKKIKKSGEIENNVYTDSQYDFTLTLLENWKPELQKPDNDVRLILNQQNHEIPPDLMQFPALAKVPELVILVGKVPMPPAAFADSLASDSYKSDVKKELLKDMIALEENVSFQGLKTTAKKLIEIDGREAVQWEGVANYIKNLGMGETISRTYAVGMVAVQKNKETIIFMLECERSFFVSVFGEVLTMSQSLKW